MASLLVIGGSGFFGKSILDVFHRNGLEKWSINKVIILSRNPQKLLIDTPELVSSDVELLQGDICTIDYLPRADYVIHAAASTDASKYLFQGEEERKNIIMGTLNYCKLAPIFHKNSKIVFCSSGAVYGFQPKSVAALEEWMDFGDVEGLSNTKRAYAYAKRDCEKAIQQLGLNDNLDVSIARCFTFVGKYLPRDQHFAIGNFIANALAQKPIEVKAKNKVYRSYMYADDLVHWLITISEFSNKSTPIYNVGSNEVIEIRDLATLVSNLFGSGLTKQKPITDTIVDNYIPSIHKASHELGLSLKFDLRRSLISSVNGIARQCC